MPGKRISSMGEISEDGIADDDPSVDPELDESLNVYRIFWTYPKIRTKKLS